MKGTLIISLDFELHWGGFEKWPLPNYQNYFLNTRNVIPQMLRMFAQHEVHVTWATVGMLFHESKAELIANTPDLKPSYLNKNLSAYEYIRTRGTGDSESDDPFHFAPSLIRQIVSTPFQELATHTFAHFYCNEPGQTVEQFRQDMKAAQRVAANYGAKLTSLVFPRNQFNDDYLHVCFQEGIRAVRSNPLDWFWNIQSTQAESKWKRLNRGLDAYLPIGKRNTYKLESLRVKTGLPVCIPASRLLRPYNPKELFLNTMKISRIKAEMERAARKDEVYHLWWHPHNFGNYPTESIHALTQILEHFDHCRNVYGMQSLSMTQAAQLVF